MCNQIIPDRTARQQLSKIIFSLPPHNPITTPTNPKEQAAHTTHPNTLCKRFLKIFFVFFDGSLLLSAIAA